MCSYCAINHFQHCNAFVAELLTSAFQEIISDSGFKVNSPVAASALQLAKDVKRWSDKNTDVFEKFSQQLIMEMEKVFVGTVRTKKSIINRDKLWRNYFLLCSSTQFRERWETFLSLMSTETKGEGALLYQRVTDIIFKLLIQEHYQIANENIRKRLHWMMVRSKHCVTLLLMYVDS